MTQRLSGVSEQEAEGVAKDIIAGSNLLLGRTSNLVRILTKHTPFLGRWFLGLVMRRLFTDAEIVEITRHRRGWRGGA
jgi:hypothetical protein